MRLASSNNNRNHEFTRNGTKLSEDDLVYDINNRPYKLSDILKENTLILRYSNSNCSMCIEQQFEILNQYKNTPLFDNVILLSHYENNRLMQRYVTVNKIHFKVFNITQNLADQIIDIGLPYYIVIAKKDYRVNKMFIPQKENSNLTKAYLESVANLFYK